MEDLKMQLAFNKVQLQTVEASLELKKDDADLKQLREDLKEVIRLTQELLGEEATSEESNWKVGDICMARCTRDKLFYKATILEILGNGSCVVNFTDYDTTDICQISHLKPVDANSTPVQLTKKESRSRKIEKKKLKKQKMLERQAEIEKAIESEKNQWVNFSKKYNIAKKTKSIFASPETVNGKVGVGTCGTAGKPMTKPPSYHRLMRK